MERIIYRMFRYAADILEERNAPGWLKNHPEIKSRQNITKSFEQFGLSSFRDKVVFESTEERVTIKKEAGEALAKLWQSLTEELEEQGITDPDILKFHTVLDMLIEILERYGVGEDFTLYKDVKFDKYRFGKGQKLTRIYTAIYNEAYRLAKEKNISLFLPALDHIPTIKALNEISDKSNEHYVVFNSGDEGTWDVCTMSERGISSCQSWDRDPIYRDNLIGSVLSRNIGVIYFTSGSKLERGEEMLKRCLIKIVLNDNKPMIIIDKMYKHHSEQIMQFFIDSLQRRSSIPVIDVENIDNMHLVTKRKDKILDNLSSQNQPYNDTHIRDFRSADLIKSFQRSVINNFLDSLGDLEYNINGKSDDIMSKIRKYIIVAAQENFDAAIRNVELMEDETRKDEILAIKDAVIKIKKEFQNLRGNKKYLQGFSGNDNFHINDAIDYGNTIMDLYIDTLERIVYNLS